MRNSFHLRKFFNFLVVLFLLLGICRETRANVIQEQIFLSGYFLGVAKARAQFIGVSDDNRILGDLTNASNAIRRAGDELARFFKPPQKRIQERERILRYISNYANATRRRSASAKRAYINQAFNIYRNHVALTYGHSRPNILKWSANCDEFIVLLGYKYGQAVLVSWVQGNRARNFQSGLLADWRDAIRKGIWISMDSENQFIKDVSIKKVCCCFGNKSEWDRLPKLNSFSSFQLFSDTLAPMQRIIREAELPPGPCKGKGKVKGPDLCGTWNNGNIKITREGNKFIARRYNLPQQFLNKGWRNGMIRMEIFIDTYNRGRFFPTWKAKLWLQNASGRFYDKDVTVDLSTGRPEGSRLYEELAAKYSDEGFGRYVKFRRYK